MTAEQRLAEDRQTRDAARAVFEQRLARVRSAVAERSISQRLASDATARAKALAGQAQDVGRDNKWVIVATATALGAWFARRPIMRLAKRLPPVTERPEANSRLHRFIALIVQRIGS